MDFDDLKHTLPSNVFTSFNQIVADILEREATLTYPEARQECDNCYLDTMAGGTRSTSIYRVGGPQQFDRGQPCPYCGGKGYKAIEKTETIKSRLYFDKKIILKKLGNSSINIKSVDLMTITNMKYLTKLTQAKYLTPRYDGIEGYSIQKFERITESLPNGFQQNPEKYVTTFWKLNNG
jgi:hypothetical protein